MDHFNFIHLFADTPGTRPGIIASIISALSAIFAFISYIKDIQTFAALAASCVAIVSGGFAISYYRLQKKKTRLEIQKLQSK